MHKIDLHIHTQKCKRGDGAKRNIKPEKFIEIMRDNKVSICSITNHNKFDLVEFERIVELDGDLNIFPGIELDVIFPNKNHRHVIVVGNPSIKYQFDEVFNESQRNFDEYIIEYDNFLEKIKKFNESDIIVIPHFYLKDKKRGVTTEEANKLREDLKNYVVVLEPKDLQSMGIINAHNDLALFGSDVKDWDSYHEIILPELKFNIDSFKKFHTLASTPKTFIKNVLEGDSKTKITESNDQKYNDLYTPIAIFDDINIVFGEKGSGKTIFLKHYVYPTLANLGKDPYYYEAKDYLVQYTNLLDELSKDIEIDSDFIGKINDKIKKIILYTEKNPENFIKKYKEAYSSQNNNKRVKKIKKANSRSPVSAKKSHIKEEISLTEENFKDIDKVHEINKSIYRNQNDVHKLEVELVKLKEDILRIRSENIQKVFSILGTTSLIQNIKASIRRQTNITSKPSSIGFSEMVVNRLERVHWNSEIKKSLKSIKVSKEKYLGKIPVKGNVYIETSIKVLPEHGTRETGSVFTQKGIKDRRKMIGKINNFKIEDFSNINTYFDSIEKDTNIEEFVREIVKKDRMIFIKKEEGKKEKYEPSEGEKAILAISGVLENRQHDYLIFDEIERGLGNKYISNYLIPKIKELRDAGKNLIISTHNANIAINTLPSQTIYCNYRPLEKDKIYYSGNMYNNELLNGDDLLSWEEVALQHLEGSHEMFGTRRDIYGI